MKILTFITGILMLVGCGRNASLTIMESATTQGANSSTVSAELQLPPQVTPGFSLSLVGI